MKKIYLFLAAVASVALVGCTSDLLVADTPSQLVDDEEGSAIIFSSLSKGTTRADFTGAEAAAKLNNKFVVAAKKGSSTASTSGTIVFDNYVVEYAENTAHTTESNVANWEYVGKGRIKHAIDHGITSQTIKYWDYSQPQYDFIAWSTGSKTAIYEGTPATGEVLVSAIDPNATASAAYTFTGTAADLRECYIADLVTVKKAQYADKDHENPVTFHFRQLGTKVRIGIYETIPGYSVKDVEFYSAAASNDAQATNAMLFTTAANEIFTSGTYTVKFPTVDTPADADNNQAHVAFVGSGDQSTTVSWGGLNYTIAEEGEKKGTAFLGRTSNTASFAGKAADNYYVIFLPNQTGTNLNLRVNYTLESIDGGGEEIVVKGATAQVPSIYTQWKPGFAYTYIFKISDKTNGHTGVYDPTKPDDTTVNSDPAGLYPITFDAIVENAEDGDATQETITLVSTPSITTYQKGSTVVNDNEYQASTGDIFVTVNDANAATYDEVTGLTVGTSSVAHYYTKSGDNYIPCAADAVAADGITYYKKIEPALPNGTLATLTGKAALYTIPAGKTEAEVVDALSMQDDDAPATPAGTIKGRSGLVLTPATFTLTNSVEYGVDGNAISVATDQALRFTPTAPVSPETVNTYAFVYTKTAPTATTDNFQPVTKAVDASVKGLYRYAQTAAPAGDVQKGVKYFTTNDASTGMITAFIGQGVGNLYTRSGEGTVADPYVYTIASGYAKTGTDYYYTLNKGQSYIKAHNVNYADFVAHVAASATIYKDNTGATAKPDTETTPVDGQDYYYKENVGGVDTYTYCVILPQQTTGLYVIDDTAAKVACGASDKAVNGMTYFDKYVKNDGVYYVKVIKVQ
jgi:hypothetical protein